MNVNNVREVIRCTAEGTTAGVMGADTDIAGTAGGDMFVRTTETYDLNTIRGAVSLIGIHSPKSQLLYYMWGGLMENHRKFRPVSCDISIACASMLPADPLQVGIQEGDIAPQDLFNPILYRAVSNDAFNAIQNRIYSMSNYITGEIGTNGSAKENKNPFSGETPVPADDIYYALLAQDGWRKAMPQSGLRMTNLRPLVYQVVNNYGNMNAGPTGGTGAQTAVSGLNTYSGTDGVGALVTSSNSSQLAGTSPATFRGPSMPMPLIPVHVDPAADVNSAPPTYVAAIVLPPSKLHALYFRMIVRWTWELADMCPTPEWRELAYSTPIANASYASDYTVQSKKMDVVTDSVDATDAEVKRVMVSRWFLSDCPGTMIGGTLLLGPSTVAMSMRVMSGMTYGRLRPGRMTTPIHCFSRQGLAKAK